MNCRSLLATYFWVVQATACRAQCNQYARPNDSGKTQRLSMLAIQGGQAIGFTDEQPTPADEPRQSRIPADRAWMATTSSAPLIVACPGRDFTAIASSI